MCYLCGLAGVTHVGFSLISFSFLCSYLGLSIFVYRNTSDNIKAPLIGVKVVKQDVMNKNIPFSLKSTCGQRNDCIFFGFV